MNRIVLVGGGRPEISEDFKAKLRLFDPSLHVSWNDFRERFVIEQCTEHFSTRAEHDHTCRRSYVWLVADEEDGSMMPLGDHVFEKLRSIDLRRQGFGPEDWQKWCQQARGQHKERKAATEKKMAEVVRECSRDNKRQLRQAIHLIQQHSLEVNQ